MSYWIRLCSLLALVALAACAPTNDPVAETVVVEPTLEVAATAAAATAAPATELPLPTAAISNLQEAPETATSLPAPTTDPPDSPETTQSTGNYVAYVQEQNLYIREIAAPVTEARQVDSCPTDVFCRMLFLKWSPDGRHLLYYHSLNHDIRMVDTQGNGQTVAQNADALRPAAWSPDGQAIAYFQNNGETEEVAHVDTETGQSFTIPSPVLEVYTAAVAEDGRLDAPQLNGTLTLDPPGCGGGGRSLSGELYEAEGGTAYGYLMAVLEWTAQDILLFTTNCTNVSIGRYDLTAATRLDHFEARFRNLVLSPDKSRWFAVSGDSWGDGPGNNELVTGDPTSTAVTTLPTSQPVEMVFVGRLSGAIYYTSRQLTGEYSFGGWPNFRHYETTLWTLQADGSQETALYSAPDHAFAHVNEVQNQGLLFVRVENDTALYEAVQNDTPADQWPALHPQRHIVMLSLPPGDSNPLLWQENAGSAAVNQSN